MNLSVRDWCIDHAAPYMTLVPSHPGAIFEVAFGPDPEPLTRIPVLQPELYMAQIDNAQAVIGSEAIKAGGDILLDQARNVHDERYDVRLPSWPAPTEYLPDGFLLQARYAVNYFHWITQVLPKLMLLERSGLPEDVMLWADGDGLEIPSFREALESLTKRKVLPLLTGRKFEFKHLFIASPMAWIPVDLKPAAQLVVGDFQFAVEAIRWLRQRLANPGKSKRKLYVVRRPRTAPARLRNNAIIQPVFEKAGFEVVYPDEMTFAEQRQTFGQAAVVAGECGAAMTNMLWAPTEATCIMFQAFPSPNIYAHMLGHVGQRGIFLVGSEKLGPDYQRSYDIQPDEIRKALRHV